MKRKEKKQVGTMFKKVRAKKMPTQKTYKLCGTCNHLICNLKET